MALEPTHKLSRFQKFILLDALDGYDTDPERLSNSRGLSTGFLCSPKPQVFASNLPP
jgi:hypothetical protein